MPKKLATLLEALDDIDYLEKLQEILAICLEELGNPGDCTQKRIEILLDLYTPHAECRLENLRIALQNVVKEMTEAS